MNALIIESRVKPITVVISKLGLVLLVISLISTFPRDGVTASPVPAEESDSMNSNALTGGGLGYIGQRGGGSGSDSMLSMAQVLPNVEAGESQVKKTWPKEDREEADHCLLAMKQCRFAVEPLVMEPGYAKKVSKDEKEPAVDTFLLGKLKPYVGFAKIVLRNEPQAQLLEAYSMTPPVFVESATGSSPPSSSYAEVQIPVNNVRGFVDGIDDIVGDAHNQDGQDGGQMNEYLFDVTEVWDKSNFHQKDKEAYFQVGVHMAPLTGAKSGEFARENIEGRCVKLFITSYSVAHSGKDGNRVDSMNNFGSIKSHSGSQADSCAVFRID
eukprot:Nk52_evm60s2367 gene=Nk52_evmTU60s2367